MAFRSEEFSTEKYKFREGKKFNEEIYGDVFLLRENFFPN
jgi:hypothetical protein